MGRAFKCEKPPARSGSGRRLMSVFKFGGDGQQRADDVTRRAYDYICNEERIKAIVAGHLHFAYEGRVHQRIPQIITGCTDARLIEFV